MFTRVDVEATSKALFCVCTRPWIGLYPEYLFINIDRRPCEYWNPYGKNEAGYVNEFSEAAAVKIELDAIAERIPHVPARSLKPWLQQVLSGNKDPMISLVLATLPNVKELVIHVAQYNRLEFTKALIGSIVTADNHLRTLPRLSKLTMSHGFDRNFRSVDTLSMLMPFMALPGLQDVTVDQAISRRLSPWPCRSKISNVIHILLHDAAITGESLKTLLSRCKALKSFGYTPCNPDALRAPSPASGIEWDPRVVRDALLEVVKDTLQKFTILDSYARPRQFIGSLRGFTALEELVIDIEMLLPYDSEFLASKLKGILPVSLRLIALNGLDHDVANHKGLLERLTEHEKGEFPNLRKVAVRCIKGVIHYHKPRARTRSLKKRR